MSEKVNLFSVIKNSGFRYLWINQILVQLVYNTLDFALIIWVFKLLDTNLAVSVLLLAVYLPSVFFGIFAGVFLDIFDRRKIILTIDLLMVLTLLVFVWIKKMYPLILINTFLANSLGQFFMPAESSSIPMLVSKKQLFLANSLFSLTLYGSVVVGNSLAGPILNTFGINAIFFIGAFLMLIAYTLAHNLPVIKVNQLEKRYQDFLSIKGLKNMFRLTLAEGKETLMFISSRLNVTVAIMLLSVVQGVIGVLAVMISSYMERILKIHASDSSYFVMLPLGLGMVTGVVLISKVFSTRPRRSIVIPGVVGAGAILMLIGALPILGKITQISDLSTRVLHPRYFFHAPLVSGLFAIAAYLLGLFTVSIIIPCQTVLQENTQEKNRGKIFAFLGVIMTAFTALPVILAGILADLFGVAPVFFTLGLLVFILGMLATKPNLFFEEKQLPFKLREFLGLEHWIRVES